MKLTLPLDISPCPTFYFLELCPEDPKQYWSTSDKDQIAKEYLDFNIKVINCGFIQTLNMCGQTATKSSMQVLRLLMNLVNKFQHQLVPYCGWNFGLADMRNEDS